MHNQRQAKYLANGHFSGPQGIAISPTGEIYVCDKTQTVRVNVLDVENQSMHEI